VTEAQAIEALTQRWIDAWPGATSPSTVPYTFRGETFDAVATWARVTFRPLVRVQATMGPVGGRRFEDRGQIFVQLFADIGTGDLLLAQLAGAVRTVYESRTIGTAELVTFAATRRAGGDRDSRLGDGRWEMSVVQIPYWFDETR
jgi:hypothetical protein